jgi:hypothetical protein
MSNLSLRVDIDCRLEIIPDVRPKGKDPPFADHEFDALYRYVLSSVEDTTTAVQIIATSLALRSGEGVATLTCVLNLALYNQSWIPRGIWGVFLEHCTYMLAFAIFCSTRSGLKTYIPGPSYIYNVHPSLAHK